MKSLILCILLTLSLNIQAQYKRAKSNDNTGLAITASGVVLGTISLLVKDGGEYTYLNGYNSQVQTKPWYQCGNRATMFGVSLTVTIGGLIYQRNHK